MLGFVLSLMVAFQALSMPMAVEDLDDSLLDNPTYEGQVSVAVRTYEWDGAIDQFLALNVMVFATQDDTERAMPAVVADILAIPGFEFGEPSAAPYGDEAVTVVATGDMVTTAYLIVRDGLTVSRWVAVRAGLFDNLPRLLAYADAHWGAEGSATPTIVANDQDPLAYMPDPATLLDEGGVYVLAGEGSIAVDGAALQATPGP